MNIGTPGKTDSLFDSSNPRQPGAASDQTATPPGSPLFAESSAPSRRHGAASLREDLATSRNKRPRIALPPAAPFETLPSVLKNKVGSFFALGSTSPSKVQGQSSLLRAAFGGQALADRLAASLDVFPPAPVPQTHFNNIIDAAQALPPALRYAVLERTTARLCQNLDRCGDNMEEVITRLLAASRTGLNVKHHYLMLENISTVFALQGFRYHFNNLDSTVVNALPMAIAFRIFGRDLLRLKSGQSGKTLGATLAEDPACRISPGTAVDADTVSNELAACAVTPIARGLYLVQDHDKRVLVWRYLMSKLAPCSPEVQATLLTRLIPSIAFLEPQAARIMQFDEILTSITCLPPEMQPGPVCHVLQNLACITDPQANTALYDRLVEATESAPVAQQAVFLRQYATALTRRPTETRVAVFARLLERTAAAPPHARAPVLMALALEIDVHAPGPQRTAAYDALLASIRQLPLPCQSLPAEQLFSGIESLPQDETRHFRFIEAIDFINSHPVENRYPMIDQLQKMIWCQPSVATELHCLGELLQTLKTQSVDQRKHALSALYEADLSVYEGAASYALLRTIFREVIELPKAQQGDLIVHASSQARDLDSPYMQSLFGDLMRHALALPDGTREQTLKEIAIRIAGAVDTLEYGSVEPGELPMGFMGLLHTSDKLPVSMRIELLAQLKRSLDACPGASLVAANKAITAKVNLLPHNAVQAFLDLHGANRHHH